MRRDVHFIIGVIVLALTALYLAAVLFMGCTGVVQGTLYAIALLTLGILGHSAG